MAESPEMPTLWDEASMTSGRSDLVDIHATLVHETELAVVLDTGDRELHWLPKAAVQDNGDGTWTMPEHLAHEKGLI